MELADMPDSKSGGVTSVWVRIPPSAPYFKESVMYYIEYTTKAGKITRSPFLQLRQFEEKIKKLKKSHGKYFPIRVYTCNRQLAMIL